MMNNWYKDWFASENYLKVYKHRDDLDANNLMQLILRNVSIDKDSKILDAACGAGRHLINLTKLGYNPLGFDLSMNLLNKAVYDAQKQNLRLNVFRSDIRETYFIESFDLILNLFTSFGYFETTEENFRFFKNAKRFLAPNGIIVFDYLNPSYVSNNLVEHSEKEVDDLLVIEDRKINNNRVEKKIKILDNDSEVQFFESVRLYDIKQLVSEFNKLGFTIEKLYGDYSGNKFNEKSSRIIIFLSI